MSITARWRLLHKDVFVNNSLRKTVLWYCIVVFFFKFYRFTALYIFNSFFLFYVLSLCIVFDVIWWHLKCTMTHNNNGLFRLLNVCGRYHVADIDLWPISTFAVADMVFYVADMVCGWYRCNSSLALLHEQLQTALCTMRPHLPTTRGRYPVDWEEGEDVNFHKAAFSSPKYPHTFFQTVKSS